MVGYWQYTIAPNSMSLSLAFRALSRANNLSGTEGNLVRSTILSASGTLIYSSIAANSSQDQTIIVPGALVGDFVLVGSPALASGLQATGFVSAPNIVTVRISNVTIGFLVPGTLVFNVTVIKP